MKAECDSLKNSSLILKLTKLEQEIRKSLSQIEKNRENEAVFIELKSNLRDLKHIVECEACHEAFCQEHSRGLDLLIKSLQELSVKAFGILEKEIACKEANSYKAFEQYHEGVQLKMIYDAEKAGVNNKSRILLIGCGAYPISCLSLLGEFNCSVVGIDCDIKAIEEADKMKNIMDLKGIDFIHSKGEDFIPKGFSHIIIASLVPDKQNILEHLYQHIDSNQLILCRFGEGLQGILNYPFPHINEDKWDKVWHENIKGEIFQTRAIRKKNMQWN